MGSDVEATVAELQRLQSARKEDLQAKRLEVSCALGPQPGLSACNTLRDFLGRETVPDSTSTDRTDGYTELADGL